MRSYFHEGKEEEEGEEGEEPRYGPRSMVTAYGGSKRSCGSQALFNNNNVDEPKCSR